MTEAGLLPVQVEPLSDQRTNHDKVVIVGTQPEALLLSVLLAEARVPNSLVGSFEPKRTRRFSTSPLDEAALLLGIHQETSSIRLVEEIEDLRLSNAETLVFVSHARTQRDADQHERAIRVMAKNAPKSFNFIFTGLSRPGYTSALGETIARFTGLNVGDDVGLCYMPLLWNGESLRAFRETPRIIAGVGDDAVITVQETFLKVFPSITSTSRIKAAEAAALFSPIYRDVVRALELELASLCAGQGLNYADALGLCRGLGLNSLGSPRAFHGFDPVGSEIALTLLRPGNAPLVIRAAKRVNERSQSQVVTMVKGALARCGQRIRHSKIAVLGLDALGVNSSLRPGPPELLVTLKKRGASLSVYPGTNSERIDKVSLWDNVKLEFSVTRAVARAHCALIALHNPENGELDPQKLASEMTRPAAICDLTGVMEASNVERAGLVYTSIGRGSPEA